MNHDFILEKVLGVYAFCGFRRFPFDSIRALEAYGYRVFSYSELQQKNPEVYELCLSYSDEAYAEPFTQTVAYNDTMPLNRIRFSLAHELGHIVLEHSCKTEYHEMEANCFASCVLAPRIAVHYCRCRNSGDIERHFGLSGKAAECAYDTYRKWRRRAVQKMFPVDRSMYQYFYDPNSKRFICGENQCFYCGRMFYNRPGNCICPICEAGCDQAPDHPFQDILSPEVRVLGYLNAL